MDKLSTELNTSVDLSDIGAIRKGLKEELELVRELITGYEERASSGLLTEQEAIHLDLMLEKEESLIAKLSDFDKKIQESIVFLEAAKSENDLFERGKRSFHDLESEKGQAQLDNKIPYQRKILNRRTRQQIIDYYKAKISYDRINLKDVYTINQFLRTLGISKTSKQINSVELSIIKTFLVKG